MSDWDFVTSKVRAPSGRAHGEFRQDMTGTSLRKRAWPVAVALFLVFFAGFITEVVGAAQTIALAGTVSLIVIYPLSGVGLLVIAFVQFRFVDHGARLHVLRIAAGMFTLVLTVAWALLITGLAPVLGAATAGLFADQLNYLFPLLIWSLAADEFNVAEGRKIFGWLVTWTYAGQVLGLLVSLGAPTVFGWIGIGQPWLLLAAPIATAVVGLWLPRAMRTSSAARGSARPTDQRSSIREATQFVREVPAWRSMAIASTLAFGAGITVLMGFALGVSEAVELDPIRIQVVLAATWLAAIVISWLFQWRFAERVADRVGIARSLVVLPIAGALAALTLVMGFALEAMWLMMLAATVWNVPRWSVDENARRGALALVPDDKRTRVSFLVDLWPMAFGLIVSAPIVGLGILTGWMWLPGVIACALAVAAIPFARGVIAQWEDSLLSWRLRRRKQNRTIGLES